MIFHVLTIFPNMFANPLSEGVVARARREGVLEVRLHNIRDYAHDRHHSVDDYLFGGGPGMVLKPAPLFEAVQSLRSSDSLAKSSPVILLSPQGRTLTQTIIEELSLCNDMALICGRYEGVDGRVGDNLVTDEISIGDYVISGGELAAMVIIDAVSRLIPGVVGSIESTLDDSFTTGLLQHPQYTRPSEIRGFKVPDVLLSGNHSEIARWRRRESLRRTFLNRPDLLESAQLSDQDVLFIESLREHKTDG